MAGRGPGRLGARTCLGQMATASRKCIGPRPARLDPWPARPLRCSPLAGRGPGPAGSLACLAPPFLPLAGRGPGRPGARTGLEQIANLSQNCAGPRPPRPDPWPARPLRSRPGPARGPAGPGPARGWEKWPIRPKNALAPRRPEPWPAHPRSDCARQRAINKRATAGALAAPLCHEIGPDIPRSDPHLWARPHSRDCLDAPAQRYQQSSART